MKIRFVFMILIQFEIFGQIGKTTGTNNLSCFSSFLCTKKEKPIENVVPWVIFPEYTNTFLVLVSIYPCLHNHLSFHYCVFCTILTDREYSAIFFPNATIRIFLDYSSVAFFFFSAGYCSMMFVFYMLNHTSVKVRRMATKC